MNCIYLNLNEFDINELIIAYYYLKYMLNLPHKNVGFFIFTLLTDELNNLIQTILTNL
ncbi:hypothetical protein GCM10007199_19270 [Fictibacillus barbaricus]|nr:hypothetical protein GCM10007199_19270 [Fictibacillus barbaricus]